MLKRVALIAYRALSDLAGKGSLLLITIAVARRLGQAEFGVFSLATTLGWILAVATDFGVQLHVARELARRPGEAPAILRTWLGRRLAAVGVALLLVAIGLAVAPDARGHAVTILLFASVYLVSGLVEFLHYVYRGLGRTELESTLVLVQRATMLGLSLVALVWRPTLDALAVAMLVPTVATFAVSARLARRLTREAADGSAGRQADPPGTEEPADGWASFRRDVAPIGLGIVLSALYFRVDLFVVGQSKGAEAVALYNAVFRLVEALRLFPAAVLAVVLPSLVRARDARPLARVAAAITLFAVAATLALWAVSGPLVRLVYGPTFAASVPAFRILLLSFPLFSLNYALTHQLVGWDRQRAYALVCGAALAVNLALNAQLVPALGIVGAAWATLSTELVVTLGCAFALVAGVPKRERAGVSVPA